MYIKITAFPTVDEIIDLLGFQLVNFSKFDRCPVLREWCPPPFVQNVDRLV